MHMSYMFLDHRWLLEVVGTYKAKVMGSRLEKTPTREARMGRGLV